MSIVRRRQVVLEEEILGDVSLETLQRFWEEDRESGRGLGKVDDVWILRVRTRGLRRSRGQKLVARGIVEREEKRVAGQEVTEITIEAIEVLLRTVASIARIVRAAIDPGRGHLGNIEARRKDIETGRPEGGGRGHQTQK
jgi:type II secretory pathway predicted ATPase ExeA